MHNHESSLSKSLCSFSLNVSSTGEAVTAISGAFGSGASSGNGAAGKPSGGGKGIATFAPKGGGGDGRGSGDGIGAGGGGGI